MRVVRSVLATAVAGCEFHPGGGVELDAAPRDSVELDVAPVACPSDYAAVDGGRYRYVPNAATWEAALADCADDGDGRDDATRHTHLVVFAGDEERMRVRDLFAGAQLWIGLSDRVTTFSWLWITGEDTGAYPPPSGAPWRSGQPTNGSGGRQDCVVMEIDGTWDDRICDEGVLSYVCECDAYAQDARRI